MDNIIEAMENLRIDDASFFNQDYATQCKYARANEMLDECIEIVMKSEQPIYEVLIYDYPWYLNELGFLDFGSEERVGFYYEKETAIRAIKENWCDLQDHYARAAAIREVKPGLYRDPPFSSYIYFLWNNDLKQWEEAEKPERVGDFC